MIIPASAATNKRHFCSHDGQELNVCFQGKVCHKQDGAGYVVDIHDRLGRNGSVSLGHAAGHSRCKVGPRVADVNLTAGDIVPSSVQGSRLGKTRYAVLGRRIRRRVWPRALSRNGAVIDDTPAARILALHNPDRLLSAQEDTGQVGVHNSFPLLEGEFFDGHIRRANSRIVK